MSSAEREARAAPDLGAARTQLRLVATLLAVAGIAWWLTIETMPGLGTGQLDALGSVSAFVVVWVAMTAAMMVPSVTPTVTLYARTMRARAPLAPLVFAAGYVLAWTLAGFAAFVLLELIAAPINDELLGHVFDWTKGGRWLAGVVLLLIAAYELTPWKDACLRNCRSPLGFLLGSWRDGHLGALRMGTKHAAWCFGCCWGMMGVLFVIGLMNIGWMVAIAALVAAQKALPWGRATTYATAAVIAALGVLVLVDPGAIPGFANPGVPMHPM